jgi:predicted outer membrane protein
MSGEKVTYVQMEEREARRLREMETHFSAVQRDLPERLRKIQSDMSAEIARQNSRLEQRWQQFQSTTDKLRSDMATLERRSQQRLQEGLARARTEYTDMIAQERTERQQQVAELRERVGVIESREVELRQMAEAWLQDLRILREEVEGIPHRRFAPGRMERIDGMIEQCALNLQNGASQTALGNAQDSYFELVEVRAEVLFREQEFETEYLRALQSVRSLIEEVRAHRQAVIPGDGQESEDIEVDVDFWSRGRLTQLSEQVRAVEARLESEKETLRLEQVRQLDEDVVALRQQLPEAVDAARRTIINSQACFNVAQTVADVMSEQGYSVEDGVYEGEDQRGAYAIKMRNRGGDEFVTIVTPSREQELAYSTQMNFYDRNQDEAMRHSFADAVYQGLNGVGLQATPPQETLGIGQQNVEARDLERFRRRQPQGQPAAGK